MGLTRITSDGITDGTISTADLADQSVTLAKLPHGTSSNNGKFLRANVGADPTFETIASFGTGSLVGDQNPQLGGDLDVNTKNIVFGDSASSSDDRLKFGADADFMIFHDGTNTKLQNDTGELIYMSDTHRFRSHTTADDHIVSVDGGAVELYFDNSVKLATINGGISVTGGVNTTGASSFNGDIFFGDNKKTIFGDGSDLQIFHNGSHSVINDNGTGHLQFQVGGTTKAAIVADGVQLYEHLYVQDNDIIKIGDGSDLQILHDGFNSRIKDEGTGFLIHSSNGDGILLQSSNGQNLAKFLTPGAGGACELYHSYSKKLETTSSGISVTGAVYSSTGVFGEGTANNIDFTTDDRMGIHINGSEEFRFEADGDFHADGDVYAFSTTIASDENLKDNITTITDAVTKVEAIKGVTFKWRENNSESAGVIAQDVEKILPEVVRTVSNPDGNSYKAVNYGGLTSILIEAIKDLSARIKVLEAK